MNSNEISTKYIVAKFLRQCKDELELDRLPEIELINDQPYVPGTTSFGLFHNDRIKVVTMNRHIMDYLRTLAHELVHWSQRIKGDQLDGNDGSATENEANAVAGVIMRRFARQNPDVFL